MSILAYADNWRGEELLDWYHDCGREVGFFATLPTQYRPE